MTYHTLDKLKGFANSSLTSTFSPIEVGLASDEDLIDTIIKLGYSFVIPYNGGYTTGDEVLLIPNDALNHAAKFSR